MMPSALEICDLDLRDELALDYFLDFATYFALAGTRERTMETKQKVAVLAHQKTGSPDLA